MPRANLFHSCLAFAFAAAAAGAADPVPATQAEALAVIDLTKFPAMDGAMYVQNSPVVASFVLPKGDPAKAVEFYRTKLTALGWKPADDPKLWGIYPQGAQLFFTKGGFVLYASLGVTPADGNLNAGLFHVGNVDARTMPKIAGAEVIDSLPSRTIYKTSEKAADVMKFTRAELKKLGWTEYARPTPKGMPAMPESDFKEMRFFNRGIGLDVTMMPFDGKNQVYLSANVLKVQLPVMPNALGLEFDADPLQMVYLTKSEPKVVLEYYEKELAALGWKRRANAGSVTDKAAEVAFDAPDKQPLKVQYLKGDIGTAVSVSEWKK